MSHRKKEKMYPLVQAWQNSQQSKSEFCEAEQINIHTFTYWLQKYKIEQSKKTNSSGSNKFLPIQIKNPPLSIASPTIEIQYPNGTQLRIHQQVNTQTLTTLLQIKL
jgi:hypothetical protein